MNNEFLSEKVFPVLDAVDAGLLDHLNPTNKGGYYLLDCPVCSKRRAFYKTGRPVICNRQNECTDGSAGVSVWKVLSGQGYSNKEIFYKLCDAVGVSPPKDNEWNPDASSGFKKITRQLFTPNNGIIHSFLQSRGLSFEDAQLMDLGFYPNPSQLKQLMDNLKCNYDEAVDGGYLPGKKNGKSNNAFQMENRVIGYWKQKSGKYGYWGYSPTDKPKYLFSSGLDKTIPYKYRPTPRLYGCEGTFDSESISRLNYPSCALGQSSISDSQCQYIKDHGTVEFIHMIDCDIAGIKGGIRSVANCYANMIKPYIGFTGWMTEDADYLRKTGENILLIHALNNPIEGPVYLSMVYYSAMNGDLPGELLSYVDKAVNSLPKPAKAQFKESQSMLGYGTPSLSEKLHKLALDAEDPHISQKTHTMNIKQLIEDFDNE